MNVWYSHNLKTFVNLDMICYWNWYSKEDAIFHNKHMEEEVKSSPGAFFVKQAEDDSLTVYFGGGTSLTVNGDDALELRHKLVPREKLLG